MIERAVKKMHEPYGRNYVWGRVADGTAQLFPGSESAVITEISERVDGSKVVHTWLAGGEFDEVVSLAAIAEVAGKKAGCIAATFTGRPGFMSKIPDGYKLAAVVMRKEL